MTPAWHVTPAQAASYADGSLPELDAWSVDKHLEACTPCAARVSAAARAGAAAPALAAVRTALLATATAPAGAGEGPAHAPRLRRLARLVRWPGGTPAARHTAAREATAPPDARAGAGKANGPGERPMRTGDPDATSAPAAARVGGHPTSVRHTGAWAGAADGRGTPLAARVGGSPGHGDGAPLTGTSRLVGGGRTALRGRLAWAAGPALRGPWLVSLVVIAVGAVCAARATGFGGVRPLLLLLAPVLPTLGVAVSYGRHADPMHEIVASTPSGGLRLLLTRTAAVLGVSVPLLTLAGLLLPATAGGPGVAAWLLPGLALTLAALALGSYVGCRAATGAVSTGWLLAVGARAAAAPGGAPALLPTDALADSLAAVLSGPAAQGCWAAAAAGCAGLLALRRTSFDRLERI
ncbi:zf-HC2 domain-containing protein [Streptomyces sp. RTd22]|uniref:zf-HC2 domain-containing protein n=1 Tax=Streptomyces sp. RTd22 TaxID=1841249 RepID=UPI0007C43E4C|nr:zf-HC2 domain-containing protein [Streptomyces sp. RTd22]